MDKKVVIKEDTIRAWIRNVLFGSTKLMEQLKGKQTLPSEAQSSQKTKEK